MTRMTKPANKAGRLVDDMIRLGTISDLIDSAPILLDDLGPEAKIGALTTAPDLGSTEIVEAYAVIYPTSHPTYDIVKYSAGHKAGGSGIDAGAGLWYPQIPARFEVHCPWEAAGLSSDFHQDATGVAIDASETDADSTHYILTGGVSNILAGADGVESGVSGVLALVINKHNWFVGGSAPQYVSPIGPFTLASGDIYYYGATFWAERAESQYTV